MIEQIYKKRFIDINPRIIIRLWRKTDNGMAIEMDVRYIWESNNCISNTQMGSSITNKSKNIFD